MTWRIVVTKNAAKDVAKLDAATQKRVRLKIEFFVARDNPLDFAQRLTDSRDGTYRWRLGAYRLVFDIDRTTVVILRVQHRSQVYKR